MQSFVSPFEPTTIMRRDFATKRMRTMLARTRTTSQHGQRRPTPPNGAKMTTCRSISSFRFVQLQLIRYIFYTYKNIHMFERVIPPPPEMSTIQRPKNKQNKSKTNSQPMLAETFASPCSACRHFRRKPCSIFAGRRCSISSWRSRCRTRSTPDTNRSREQFRRRSDLETRLESHRKDSRLLCSRVSQREQTP